MCCQVCGNPFRCDATARLAPDTTQRGDDGGDALKVGGDDLRGACGIQFSDQRFSD